MMCRDRIVTILPPPLRPDSELIVAELQYAVTRCMEYILCIGHTFADRTLSGHADGPDGWRFLLHSSFLCSL